MKKAGLNDYLVAVRTLCREATNGRAMTGDIARQLGVSKGTVSTRLKSLAEAEWLTLHPYEGATLTEKGVSRAISVIRRTEAIDRFLVAHFPGVPAEVIAKQIPLLEPVLEPDVMSAIEKWCEFQSQSEQMKS